MHQLPNHETNVPARILESLAKCLTPEVAQEIIKLQANSTLQARIGRLADKSTEGALTKEERDEYESYVHATSFISNLQAKIRQLVIGVQHV